MYIIFPFVRYATLGNLSGVPGITVPVGYSEEDGLPIALQIMSPWWREDVMFRIAHAMESNIELRKPQVYFDVISENSSDITSDDESQ